MAEPPAQLLADLEEDRVVLVANGTIDPAWYVFSGRDGRQLLHRDVARQVRSLAGMGDLDRDGFADVAVSFFGAEDVEVWSGRSRQPLRA